jgi:hypothetical protein
MFGICAGGCNTVDGLEDKQDGGIIFSGFLGIDSVHPEIGELGQDQGARKIQPQA